MNTDNTLLLKINALLFKKKEYVFPVGLESENLPRFASEYD